MAHILIKIWPETDSVSWLVSSYLKYLLTAISWVLSEDADAFSHGVLKDHHVFFIM